MLGGEYMTNKFSKFISLILALSLICSFFCINAYADIRVVNNGKDIIFDVSPQIINDRTMVPMRKIFETLGADVEWNDADSSINATKEGINIHMQIGNPIMKVNAKEISLDSPPIIVDDRTLVPVRAIAEAFNVRTSWDPVEEAVILSAISKSQNGENTFDEEKYELKKPGIKTVNIGGTIYGVSVPENMICTRQRDYMNNELFSDNVISYSDGITMYFNTGAYEYKNGLFKSFDEFYNDYHRRWPSATDMYENISFDYKIDDKYEVMSYINKHTVPYRESSDPDIWELEQALGMHDEKADDVTYEGEMCILNLNDYTDVGVLSIKTEDESKIDIIRQLFESMHVEG